MFENVDFADRKQISSEQNVVINGFVMMKINTFFSRTTEIIVTETTAVYSLWLPSHRRTFRNLARMLKMQRRF